LQEQAIDPSAFHEGDLQERFERWAESRCYYLDKSSDGKYLRETTSFAWSVWKDAQRKVNLHKDRLDNPLAD